MDRESRINIAIALCYIAQFTGLYFFMFFDSHGSILWQSFAYCMVAISGFAGVINALIAERIDGVVLTSGGLGLGLLIFSLLKLAN